MKRNKHSTHLRVGGEGLLVQSLYVHVQRGEVGSAEAGGGASEAAVHDLVRQPHGLKHL